MIYNKSNVKKTISANLIRSCSGVSTLPRQLRTGCAAASRRPSIRVSSRSRMRSRSRVRSRELCDLPGCADAEVCQNDSPNRRVVATLADRQFDCPPGVECGPGPECTVDLCDLPGCADAEVCQNQDRKRSATTDIVPPTCDICIVGANGVPVCGCATPSDRLKRRTTEKVCPEFCIVTEDGETLCGCAAEAYEESS